jgi:hypothetical protein
MARTIWKFPLEVIDQQSVRMPIASRMLHVGMQGGTLCLWAEVTPGAEQEDRAIYIYGTGHDLAPDRGDYLGTFQMHGGALVFHAYAPAS